MHEFAKLRIFSEKGHHNIIDDTIEKGMCIINSLHIAIFISFFSTQTDHSIHCYLFIQIDAINDLNEYGSMRDAKLKSSIFNEGVPLIILIADEELIRILY